MLAAVRGYQLAGGEGLNNKLGSNKVREENNYRWRGAAAEGMKLKGSGEDRLEVKRTTQTAGQLKDTRHQTCRLPSCPSA